MSRRCRKRAPGGDHRGATDRIALVCRTTIPSVFVFCAQAAVAQPVAPPQSSAPGQTAPSPAARATPPPPSPSPRSPPPTSTPPPPPTPPASGRKLADHAVEHAGEGGAPYASRGVLVLGGSAGLSAGSETTQLTLTPQAGWFIMDNLEISTMLDLTHIATDGGRDMTSFTILGEPSYHVHVPVNTTTLAFAGLGLGVAWENERGIALAAVPRIGVELLIGRSGILTPAVSWTATTHDDMEQTNALRLNLGYSVMW